MFFMFSILVSYYITWFWKNRGSTSCFGDTQFPRTESLFQKGYIQNAFRAEMINKKHKQFCQQNAYSFSFFKSSQVFLSPDWIRSLLDRRFYLHLLIDIFSALQLPIQGHLSIPEGLQTPSDLLLLWLRRGGRKSGQNSVGALTSVGTTFLCRCQYHSMIGSGVNWIVQPDQKTPGGFAIVVYVCAEP